MRTRSPNCCRWWTKRLILSRSHHETSRMGQQNNLRRAHSSSGQARARDSSASIGHSTQAHSSACSHGTNERRLFHPRRALNTSSSTCRGAFGTAMRSSWALAFHKFGPLATMQQQPYWKKVSAHMLVPPSIQITTNQARGMYEQPRTGKIQS